MNQAPPPSTTPAASRSSLSIAITYPVALAFVIGLVVLLMGILTTTGMQRSTRDLLDQLIHQVTERMRLSVTDSLQMPYLVCELIVDGIENGRTKFDDMEDLEAFMPTAAATGRAFPSVGSILIATANDDVMWVERRQDDSWKVITFDHEGGGKAFERRLDAEGRPTGAPFADYPYVPAKRPWYETAVEAGPQGAWNPLYVWATSEDTPPIGSGFSREILDETGHRLAIVEVGFTNRELSEQMSRISIGREGRVMIVDADGNIVATDEPAIRKSIDGKVLAAVEVADPVLAAVAALGNERTNTRIEEPAGYWWEAESEPLGVDWGPDWHLILAIPDAELLAGVREVQNSMVAAGFLVLGGCALIGFAVARSIVRPIVALRGTAAAIAKGDLEASFTPHGGREFMELSRDLSSMTNGLRERIEMQGAMEVAMEVQQNLLPRSAPEMSGLDIAATSIYSDETGGDYFDFPETEAAGSGKETTRLLAIGDVTGHGIGAALIMASARSALRTRLRLAESLGDLLEDVNATLVEDIPMGRFMTLLIMRIETDRSGFHWASAGHDPPIIYDPGTDSFSEPDGGGVPLGVVEGETFEEYRSPLHGQGTIVVTATDGVWETIAPDGEFYGKDRLRDLIREHRDRTANEIMEAVIQDTNRFRGNDRAADDVTMVVFKLV